MMKMTRRLCLGVCALALSMAASAGGDYPNKTIRWVVGYPAGAASDYVARTVAHELSQRLGQSIVIENRPGSSGMIAADAAAKAPADGYTITTVDNGILVFNTELFKKLPYSPKEDFAAIGQTARLPMLVLSHPDSSYKTIGDVVEAMKSKPGDITYATPGVGTPHNLAMEMFIDDNQLRTLPIHYRGGAPMIQDLMGRHVDLMVLDIVSSAPLIKSGKVRPLVVFSKERLASLPDVPTTLELGLGQREAFAWQGLAVPAGTPEAVQKRLSEALMETVASEAVQKKLKDYGAEPTATSAAEMTQLWLEDDAYWAPFIKSKGIRAE